MSFPALRWAFDRPVSNSSEKLVLLALANYANSDGECWPHVDTIATDTMLSIRTVRSCLKALDGKHIAVQKLRGKSGQQAPSSYALLMEDAECNDCTLEENQSAKSAKPECKKRPNQSATIATIYKEEPVIEPVIEPRARARQIPPDFTLTPERLEAFKAIAGDLDPVAEFEHFTDHHRSVGKPYKDWDACWRNWARNAVKFSRKPHAETKRSLSAPDRVRAANAKREAERNAAARNRGVLAPHD